MTSFAQRLTFWFLGSDSPPNVPHPKEIKPIVLEARLMLNLDKELPKNWTPDQVVELVNNSITDRELQAHALQAMKDELGWVFNRTLNPNMPQPRYWDPKNRLVSQ